MDYRITFFSVTPYFGYVIMEKRDSGGGEKGRRT
jgi:hypothetical protein